LPERPQCTVWRCNSSVERGERESELPVTSEPPEEQYLIRVIFSESMKIANSPALQRGRPMRQGQRWRDLSDTSAPVSLTCHNDVTDWHRSAHDRKHNETMPWAG